MRKVLPVILTLLVIMFFSMVNNSYALSFKLETTPDITSLKPGQTVITTIKVKSVDMGELGCNLVEGAIEYDKNIFETLKQEDIEGMNNWTVTYNEENVAKVKLKVKEGVNKTTTTVKYTNLATNDGVNNIKEEDKSVGITIVKEAEEDNSIIIQNSIPGNNGQDNTLSPNKIPNAGRVTSIIIGLALIILIVLYVIKVVRIRKID